MRSRVYVTVGRPSVRLSVCPVDRQQLRRSAGLLLSATQAGYIDRQLQTRCWRHASGAGTQQQMRAASCWEPTEEAQHRLDLLYIWPLAVLGKIIFQMISNQNQNHESLTDLKLWPKSNHKKWSEIKIAIKMILNHTVKIIIHIYRQLLAYSDTQFIMS